MSALPFDEAFDRVGVAMYGASWISALSERELWLLRRYVDGDGTDTPGPLIPGRVTYFVIGSSRKLAEWPIDPALKSEVEQALDRREWRDCQHQNVFEWFKENGLNLEADLLDADIINRKLGNSSPIRDEGHGKAQRKTGRKPIVEWPTVEAKAIELMEYRGDFQASEPDWNAQARLIEELQKFCRKKFGCEPSETVFKERIPSWLERWREGRRK